MAGFTFVGARGVSAQDSPASTVSVSVNGKTISITYSAPSVRGRVIFCPGNLVSKDPTYPVWRAGANAATLLQRIAALVIQNGDIYEDQLGPKYAYLTEYMEGLKQNLAWFPRYQAYLREHQPPTLIVWGPQDGYMPEGSARAYLRDLPNAELHFVDGGHWPLETNLDDVVALTRQFLSRVHTA